MRHLPKATVSWLVLPPIVADASFLSSPVTCGASKRLNLCDHNNRIVSCQVAQEKKCGLADPSDKLHLATDSGLFSLL